MLELKAVSIATNGRAVGKASIYGLWHSETLCSVLMFAPFALTCCWSKAIAITVLFRCGQTTDVLFYVYYANVIHSLIIYGGKSRGGGEKWGDRVHFYWGYYYCTWGD